MCRVSRAHSSAPSARPPFKPLAAYAATLAFVTGCSLDTRELMPRAELGAEAGSSASSTAGAANGDRGGAAHSAGASGAHEVGGGSNGGSGEAAGPAEAPLIDGCPDLDGNQIGDCKETLLDNASFKSDVVGWAPELDATVAWDDQNATADLPSGSALVAATGVLGASAQGALRDVTQCLKITGKRLVTVYANAFVDAGQDEEGQAEIDVFFFDDAGCAGTFTSSFSTPQPLDASVDAWIELKAGSVSTASTQSVLVKLAVLKPFRAESFHARFDNVLVKIQPL